MAVALQSAVLLVALLGASEAHRGCSGCSSASEPSPSALGNYSQWAVATDAAPCANVSRRIRQKGGTLADAAVATLLCMGVALPESMGIGGGFLATVVKRSSGLEFALNARETAPGGASKDMFVDNPTAAKYGGLAVAVPGALRGYRALLDTFGTSLEWSVLFEDAIRLARNGFPLGFFQADALKEIEHDVYTNENMRNVYWNPRTNTTYKEGETLLQKDLADTLENIAKHGVDYFYKGEFAEGMIQEIQKQKGLMTTGDLSSYKVVWNRTTTARLSGGRVLHSVPPPGSGAVLAHILAIMDGYRDHATGRLADDSLTAHRFVESCKFAYAKRSQLGDSAFVDVTKLVDQMTSSDYADRTRKKIQDGRTFGPSYYSGLRAFRQDHGTSHLSLLDENGDAIAVTATINTYFGSQVVFRGVVLNNHMDDFSIPGESNAWGLSSSEPNFVRPGKRPMSSTAPSVVVDRNGDVELVLGGSGGSKITSAVAWASMRCLWQDRTIKDAIDSPRVHHQWLPNEVDVEPNFSEATIKYFEQNGHKVIVSSGPLSFLGGIVRRNGRIFANYDYRRGGSSDGD